ncbi:MAG: hypothetical protein WCC64_01590, partial [Aliidongia sp.]
RDQASVGGLKVAKSPEQQLLARLGLTRRRVCGLRLGGIKTDEEVEIMPEILRVSVAPHAPTHVVMRESRIYFIP